MLTGRVSHPAMAAGYAVRFDPSTALVALSAALVDSVGAARQGSAERDAAEFQARVLEQDAERQKKTSADEAIRLRRRGSQLSARQRAALAGAGVAQSGTPLLVLADTAAETERQANLALAGGDTAAARARQEAALQRLRGRRRRESSLFRSGRSLLSQSAADLFSGSGPTA